MSPMRATGLNGRNYQSGHGDQSQAAAERQGWVFGDTEKACSRCGENIVWAAKDGKNASFVPGTGQFHLKVCGQGAPATSDRPERTQTPATPIPPQVQTQVQTATLITALVELTIAVKKLSGQLDSRMPSATRDRFDVSDLIDYRSDGTGVR